MKRSEIPIPIPCTENWDTMTPAGRTRFCATCKKHVQDISGMTEEDAREVLARRVRDDLCVSYLFDKHGDVVFQMVDTRIIPPNRLVRAGRAAATAAAAFALSTTIACGGGAGEQRLAGVPPHEDMERVAGGMMPYEPPPPVQTATPVEPTPVATSVATAAPPVVDPPPVATAVPVATSPVRPAPKPPAKPPAKPKKP